MSDPGPRIDAPSSRRHAAQESVQTHKKTTTCARTAAGHRGPRADRPDWNDRSTGRHRRCTGWNEPASRGRTQQVPCRASSRNGIICSYRYRRGHASDIRSGRKVGHGRWGCAGQASSRVQAEYANAQSEGRVSGARYHGVSALTIAHVIRPTDVKPVSKIQQLRSSCTQALLTADTFAGHSSTRLLNTGWKRQGPWQRRGTRWTRRPCGTGRRARPNARQWTVCDGTQYG